MNKGQAAGPLKHPTPPDAASHRTLERLKGHTTSPDWLPAGVWPEARRAA
jgi:hypothetical protein